MHANKHQFDKQRFQVPLFSLINGLGKPTPLFPVEAEKTRGTYNHRWFHAQFGYATRHPLQL